MASKSECREVVSDKRIVFSENKSKLTFINEDQGTVTKIKVDGCEITSGIRCDFLLLKNNTEYFIELKGQDIIHAIDQIKSTIIQLSTNFRKTPKISFIICTRSPLTSAKIQNIQLKLKRDYNSNLIVKTTNFEYNI